MPPTVRTSRVGKHFSDNSVIGTDFSRGQRLEEYTVNPLREIVGDFFCLFVSKVFPLLLG